MSLERGKKKKKLKQEVMMTINKNEIKQLPINSDINAESPLENEQAVIEALERYLRLSSLTRAHPLPRWVMW